MEKTTDPSQVNDNFKVFALTQLGLEPTINRTRGDHNNDYTSESVLGKF